MARRTARSRCRSAPRASSRFAMFAQAMSSTKTAEACQSARIGPSPGSRMPCDERSTPARAVRDWRPDTAAVEPPGDHRHLCLRILDRSPGREPGRTTDRYRGRRCRGRRRVERQRRPDFRAHREVELRRRDADDLVLRRYRAESALPDHAGSLCEPALPEIVPDDRAPVPAPAFLRRP